MNKRLTLLLLGCLCFLVGTAAYAISGLGSVATQVTSNLPGIAKLVTGASYVGGMAFIVGAIVKFKAHKDQPTQIPIGTPIALLFIGAGLTFVPGVFKAAGMTLFGQSGAVPLTSGITSFGVGKPGQSG